MERLFSETRIYGGLADRQEVKQLGEIRTMARLWMEHAHRSLNMGELTLDGIRDLIAQVDWATTT